MAFKKKGPIPESLLYGGRVAGERKKKCVREGDRERERKRKRVCMCERGGERKRKKECVCVCEREREGERNIARFQDTYCIITCVCSLVRLTYAKRRKP